MASLRSRLYFYLIVAIAPLLIAIGIGLSFAVTVWLESDFDDALQAKARALVALTRQDAGGIEFEYAGVSMPEFESAAAPEYFELWLDVDTLFERSRSFEFAGRESVQLVRQTPASTTPRFVDARLPDGRKGRQIQIDFRPQFEGDLDSDRAGSQGRQKKPTSDAVPEQAGGEGQVLTLVVARERESLDGQIRLLNAALALAALVLFLAFAALIPVLLRSALRPLDSLISQARGFGGISLGNRFVVPGAPDEIEPVVNQLNLLLESLEKAILRERRLSSDIAHELKTPVAELRNLCEVGERWPEDTDEVRAFFEDARSISLHMERVVNQLLLLARYEEGGQPIKVEKFFAAEAIDTGWCSLAALARDRGIVFRNDVPAALPLETDPGLFELIVVNLLSNAATYGDADSTVTCTAGREGDRLSLCFANRASYLEPGDLAVMFDRFWRKDDARTGGQNLGLGLSLVRAFADLLDIEVESTLDADQVLKICLVMSQPATP